MADFNLDLSAGMMTHGGGIMGTGVHTVTVEEAFVTSSKNGDPMVDIQLRSDEGAVGFIQNVGIKPKWSTGSENYQYGRLMEMFAAMGVENISATPCKRKYKDAEQDAQCITEIKNKKLKVAVNTRFDVYNNEEKKTLDLYASFDTDGRTPAEKKANKEATVIYKIADRMNDYETPAYKTWKEAKGVGETPAAAGNEATPADTNIFG